MTFQRFVNYLDEHKIEYRLFVPQTKNEENYNNQILMFASIPFFLYPECRFTFPNVYQIKKELKVFRPDLIHIATPINIGLSGLYYGTKLIFNMFRKRYYYTEITYSKITFYLCTNRTLKHKSTSLEE